MVTYSELIQIGILIVGIIGLFMQAQKKITAQFPNYCGYFFKLKFLWG